MPDNKRNLQIRQPGIEGYDVDDKNGWPTPLTDASDPLKLKVTNGSNGEQRNFRAMATSTQNDLSLTEGDKKYPGPEADGPVYGGENAPTGLSVAKNTANPLETSANLRGQLSRPEGGSGSDNK
jgi:hypothetical protein